MKDLGFNEFGELNGNQDEENTLTNSSVEMSNVSQNPYLQDDPDGDEEAEDTEIAI